MLSQRLLLLLAALFVLSCNKRRDITIYDTQYQVLNGKVKDLTEIYKNFNGNETDVTTFDNAGNAISMSEKGGACGACEIQFSYKHGKDGKKTEVIMIVGKSQQPYKCDTNGRIAEERFNTKDYDFDKEDWAKRREVFKYDGAGYMTKSTSYQDTSCLSFTTYKYNKLHLLTEVDTFSGASTLLMKVTYKYLSIDKKENWLKRASLMERYLKMNSRNQRTVSRDTDVRKITYY